MLAVFVPTFVKNLHASRLAEPLDALQRISGRAAQLADGAAQLSAYPESAPLTPARVPRGEPVQDPPGTWDHPTWRLLDFSFSVPHCYSFELNTKNAADVSRYSAVARGDLDGDGVLSSFTIEGSIEPAGVPHTGALEVNREVE
jgi:type IV pilus assembly protein PilA